MKYILPCLTLCAVLFSCSNNSSETSSYKDQQTQNLYKNLQTLSEQNKIMFGCANPTTLMYKTTHIYKGFNNSDCKEITGHNPAYYESDFMWFDKDSLHTADLIAMRKAYERGAVIGYCWHLRGMNSNSFYSKKNGEYTSDKNLVRDIISNPDRKTNATLDWLLTEIDTLVIPTLKELNCPITFRPWHEMNGGWFWWGSQTCTPEEYIKLYRLTVDYLRNKGLKNILYVWSPDTQFAFEYYPGDKYVDILGLDIYEMGAVDYKPMSMVIEELEKLTDYAADHNKLAAITETGLRMDGKVFRYPNKTPYYWTQNILKPIINNEKLQRLVWVESWYSSDWSQNRESQFYYPYIGIEKDQEKGQEAIDDFIRFFNHPATLFENDLPNMYE